MSVSLNGWSTISNASDARLKTLLVPGTRKRLTARVECLPLLLAVAHDIDRTVIDIDGGPFDGWQYRQARAANGFSNHASGTAFDFRYDVLPADHKRHCSTHQINAMHRLLDTYVTHDGRRVLAWGGDWRVGTYCDEMHVEIAQSWAIGTHGKPVTAADVADVIKRLHIDAHGVRPNPLH